MTADTYPLSEHKRCIASVYNMAAGGYDRPALRFFKLTAGCLVERAHVKPEALVLDAATGTGAAAFAAAKTVGPRGRVTGVDIATDMLALAKHEVASQQLTNITMQYGDIEHLDFAHDHFDTVLCASGIFCLPDMPAALKEWWRATKPGGTVAFSSYGKRAFQPLSDLYEARIRRLGVRPAARKRPFLWQRLSDPEQCHDLLRTAGFAQVDVRVEQLGYFLDTTDEWWEIVCNSGFRFPVSQLSSAQWAGFKQEHLAEVRAMVTGKGIWLDVPALIAVGQKP
jgi:arsenite methyltransferase